MYRMQADAVRVDQMPLYERPRRPEERFDYDLDGALAFHSDELGRITTWETDRLGRVLEELLPDPDGLGPLPEPRTVNVYDKAGNLTSVFTTDGTAAGTETAFEYTAQNWVKKITRGANTTDEAITEWKYDEWGRVTEETVVLDSGEGANRVTTWDYEDFPSGGGLPYVTQTLPDPDGDGTENPLQSPVYVRTFDLHGNLVKLVEPDDGSGSPTTDYKYDRMERLIEIQGATVNSVRPVTTFVYNKAGDLLSTADSMNRDTVYGLDDHGRVLTITDELNHTTTLVYDRASNVISTTDELDQTTLHSYNARNQRISTKDPRQGVTQFSFDAATNLIALTDAEGNTTRWLVDNLDRPIAETNELGDTRYTSYDASGNVAAILDRNGQVREFSHDPLFRLTEERWKDGTTTVRTISFLYNDADEMTSASDSDSAYAFVFDTLGRVTSIDNDGTVGVPNVVLAQGWDVHSRLTTLSAEIDSTADFLNTYSFDTLHRMTRVEQEGQSGGNSVAEKRVDFTYNLAGQFTEIARFNDTDGGAGNEVATSVYTHDDLGRLTGLAHKKGGNNLFTPYSWQYDAINRVTQFVSQDGTNNYGYNANSELTSASLTSESYAFDATGNRTTTGYVTGPNNQLQDDGTFTYTYDGEGNRITRTRKVNDPQNPVDDYLVEYSWDHRQRLTEVRFKNNSGTVTKVVAYAYDVFDRRILRKLDTTSPFDLQDAAIEGFVYDQDNVVLDFLDPDGAGSAQQAIAKRYLHGAAVDQIMAQENVGVSAPDNVLWHLGDNQGTTRDLVDNAGNLETHITYTAFGQPLSGSITTTRYLFTAREYDAATGMQYNRARWYDPAVGRWISEDWIGFDAGDANLSRYVGNSPTNATDPSGLEPPWWNDGWWDNWNPFAWSASFGDWAGTSIFSPAYIGSDFAVNRNLGSSRINDASFGRGNPHDFRRNQTAGQFSTNTMQNLAGLDAQMYAGAAGFAGRSAAACQVGRGSTANLSKGTTLARNLREQLAIEEALSNPAAGAQLRLKMNDPRWPAGQGWVKMQQKILSGGREGDINVHYTYNTITREVDDAKIVLPGVR